MAKDKKYTENDIEVLSDREHVRLRLPVYAGNTSLCSYDIPLFLNEEFTIKKISFIPAAYKCIGEIIDNAIDEFSQVSSATKLVTIQANNVLGTYTISDTGRGVPIGKHKTGKYTPEVVFGSLRSGRNFSGDKTKGVIGMNGMGSSITCFCSTDFTVDIRRDGKRYVQNFSDGGLKVSKPSITKTTDTQTGTTISFQLDPEVFDDISLPDELTENRAMEIALTNPSVGAQYNGKRYRYRNGFEQLIKKISNNYFKFEKDNMEFFVIFDLIEGIDERVFSWVNSSLLFDGGICNTQFLNAFYDSTISHLSKDAKKHKCVVTKNDIRQNLLVLGNLKISNPEYDAQSKTRLTGPNMRTTMHSLVGEQYPKFAKKHKEWIDTVLERAISRHHISANKKATQDHQKNLKKRVIGLKDATSKNRQECKLLITEGDSAASMITDVRDPRTTAALPLRGKVNNVYGVTVAQLLGMGKVSDLLTAIGLVPGKKALRGDLRYGKIIIATDADVDGNDIFTLLINLFFQFWPELFDPNYEPIVYRLVAPNVCVAKKNKRIHFPGRGEYEKNKHKYKNGWETSYYKGLGSMVRADWEIILNSDNSSIIPITNDGDMGNVMELLFGPSADDRKEWLQKSDINDN